MQQHQQEQQPQLLSVSANWPTAGGGLELCRCGIGIYFPVHTYTLAPAVAARRPYDVRVLLTSARLALAVSGPDRLPARPSPKLIPPGPPPASLLRAAPWAVIASLSLSLSLAPPVMDDPAVERRRADSVDEKDESRLAQFGYKQELRRDWGLAHNFGVSFSIIVRSTTVGAANTRGQPADSSYRAARASSRASRRCSSTA